jgi:hypothetical protein
VSLTRIQQGSGKKSSLHCHIPALGYMLNELGHHRSSVGISFHFKQTKTDNMKMIPYITCHPASTINCEKWPSILASVYVIFAWWLLRNRSTWPLQVRYGSHQSDWKLMSLQKLLIRGRKGIICDWSSNLRSSKFSKVYSSSGVITNSSDLN